MGISKVNRNFGSVQRINIDDEMRGAYLDYAMSVIVSRALPDVRDGLKPVHRRILYAMYDMGLRPNRPYKKSARIVGEVLGKYHPHGDGAVYDAMVRMAQDFSMRYMLVDGQGNFGSVDGDAAAAMRYTEARLTEPAIEMLVDIDKETVAFKDNFDGSMQEPIVLPARLPNLLINGGGGIAVGMATNIPPHNFTEVCNATIFLIDNWHNFNDITVDDLMAYINGPDFPTGAQILGMDGIRSAFATGRGRVVIRARTEIQEMPKGNRFRIVVSEIPFQVNKAVLIERIAELVRNGRLTHISDLRDESDRDGLRIVIELKRGAYPAKVRNQLFKYTQLQATFGVNMLALVNGGPRLLSLKQILRHYIEHRQDVIRRRSEYELKKARHRAHILEGLLSALDHLDPVIETIRKSPSAETARNRLVERFDLSELQARAILDMQLRRLAALERQKITDEHQEIQIQILYLEGLLAQPEKILALIRQDLTEVRDRFGDPRRTEVVAGHDGSFNEEDLIPNIQLFVTVTERGYVKRVPAQTYRAQHRGGKGITGMKTGDEDSVMHAFACMAHDDLLFFTNKGKVYQQRAYDIPDASRVAKGIPLINIVQIDPNERVTTIVAVPDWEKAHFFVMLTEQGRIKRIPIDQLNNVRNSGLIAIKLDDEDNLRWVKMTHGDQELILVTERGQAIRFHEDSVRSMGRAAAGVMAIRLEDEDKLAAMDICRPAADLLILTSEGYGKRTPLDEYSSQNRFGKGVRTIARALKITGPIVDARVVEPDDEITIISAHGMVMRTQVEQIAQYGRATRGVRVMGLKKGDRVASLALLDEHTLNDAAKKSPSSKKTTVNASNNGHATHSIPEAI
ncbi:MAG: DNA gyrase subunit A [Ardenticatenaceae bacterium]